MPIEEEDEDEDEDGLRGNAVDGEVEEVESFSPVIRRPGEMVEEIYEDNETITKSAGSEAVSPLTERPDALAAVR